ncbi:MAG: ferrous iron transport protein A [Deltaproteobacteria bacterium]|jgi:ferrous iron transport protein A|nr:ferrous iron transport protein A [Deltaproteobacteria bacterium]
MGKPLRLNTIVPGEKVRVIEIRGGGQHLRRRLIEMGVVRGAPVKVQRVAPLGDPMEIRLSSSSLSLRMAEAHHVIVERDV